MKKTSFRRPCRTSLSRAFCILLLTTFLISLFPASFAESDVPEIIGGTAVDLRCGQAETVEVSGTVFSSMQSETGLRVVIVCSDVDSAYSKFTLNGTVVGSVKQGENELILPVSSLNDGVNRLGIRPGRGSGTYTESDVYGTVNLDDTTIESVRFPDLEDPTPKQIEKWMPIQNSAGKTVKTDEYKDALRIGDGWFEATGLGGSDLSMPLTVDILFDRPDLSGRFRIDTTLLPEGTQDFVFRKGTQVLETRKYTVDNTGPVISFSHENGVTLCRKDTLTADAEDASGKVTIGLYVDGEKVARVRLNNMDAGVHSFSAVATDKGGNESRKTMVFRLTDRDYLLSEDGLPEIEADSGRGWYAAKLLTSVRMYDNPYGTLQPHELRSSDERLISIDGDKTTVAAGEESPYQSFVVKVTDKDAEEILISYTGETGNHVPVRLTAWNPETLSWDVCATVQSGEPVSFLLPIKPYGNSGYIRVNATPLPVANGSDTVLWVSDTQYYSYYEDLQPYYTRICEYFAEEYADGNAAYVVHTGDVVDQTTIGDDIAHAQFRFASEAQAILDEANVPNGIVSGNHDVKHTAADYSYYLKYFNSSRYTGKDWYGGQLHDGVHHYDLVSVGAYDFLFLYIGCYRGSDEDFIDWANAVCKAYPERNVVLCTHIYLNPDGSPEGPDHDAIWEQIAVPNDNVKMILCGHVDGVCDQWHSVEGTDRKVLEILANYQFAENGQGPQHMENGYQLDGEGYIRRLTFLNTGELAVRTYSPVAGEYGLDPYCFFPYYAEEFTYDLDLVPADRSLHPLSFQAAVPGEGISVSGSEPAGADPDAMFAKLEDGTPTVLYVRKDLNRSYDTEPVSDADLSSPEPDDRVTFSGREYVSPLLHFTDTASKEDALATSETTLDLLENCGKNWVRTSGTEDYTFDTEQGVSVLHHGAGANWVTLTGSVGKTFDADTYPYLYFGVTADRPQTKWNIVLTIGGRELSFSRTEALARQFGYRYELPSDICGSWRGVIDLSEFVQGNTFISGVYLVCATPDQTVRFDYLTIGRETGGSLTFRLDENTAETFFAPADGTIDPPATPLKSGMDFAGWYDAKEGGNRVETFLAAADGKTLYARYTEKTAKEARLVEYYTEELPFSDASYTWIWFLAGGLLLAVAAVVIVILIVQRKKKPAVG